MSRQGSLSKGLSRLKTSLLKRRSPEELLRHVCERPITLRCAGSYGSLTGEWLFSTESFWFQTGEATIDAKSV